MMFEYNFLRPSIVILLFFFATLGCKQDSKKALLTEKDSMVIASNKLALYRKVINNNKNDSLTLLQLEQILLDANSPCPAFIVDSITKKISSLRYNNAKLSETAEEIFSRSGNNTALSEMLRAKVFLALSSIYAKQKKLNETDSTLALALKHKEGFTSNMWMGYYNRLGLNYFYQNKMIEATDLFTKGITLGEKENSKDIALSNLYTNVGTLYNQIGDYANAIAIFKKNIEFIASTTHDINSITDNLSNIGVVYGTLLQQPDSAIAYFEKGLAVQQQNKGNDKNEQVFTLFINIASIFSDKKKYDSARYYQKLAFPLLESIQDPVARMTFILNDAVAFANVRDVSKEVNTIKGYLPDFYKDNNLEYLQNAYQSLAVVSTLRNQFSDALKYHSKLDSIANVMTSDKNKQIVNEMNIKYETAKKDLKLKEQQEDIEQKRNWIIWLIGVLLLGTLVTLLISYRRKLQIRKKESLLQQQFTTQLIAQTEEERTRIARDLHDGVSQELMLLKEKVLLGEAPIQNIEAIIQEIRGISRNLHPEMLDKIGLEKTLAYLCEQTMECNELFISWEMEFTHKLSKDTELQLYRIVQESLNNAIKHAKAEAVKLTIKQTRTELHLEIKDNGKGFDVDGELASSKSFGLHSILARCKAINGKASILSSSAGTIIKIIIPV